ncbi:MAG: translocation/assembly module TamB domain-containing protein [Gammaproteobacteria bacterium]|nr:translocation/assembly module TamB domain-containing protein [Gammaproteobacteria bacterium]
MFKAILKNLLCIFAILLLIASAGYFVCNTSAGLRFSLEICSKFFPGKFSLKTATGTLTGPLVITGLNYNTRDYQLAIKSLEIKWQPAALLDNKIQLQELIADDVKIKTFESAPTKKTSLFFPIKLQLAGIKLTNVAWEIKSGQTIKIDNIAIPIWVMNKNNINITANLQSKNATAAIVGELGKKWQLHWQIHVPKIEQIFSSAHGDLESVGDIAGFRNNPEITANFQASNFKMSDLKIAKFVTDLKYNTSAKKVASFNATANNLNYKNMHVDGFTLLGTTTSDKKNLQQINLELSPIKFAVLVNGVEQNYNLAGASGKFTLGNNGITGQVKFLFEKFAPFIADISLPGAKTIFGLTAKQALALKWHWETTDLQFFHIIFPELTNISGKMFLNGEINGTVAAPKFTAKLKLLHLAWFIPGLNITPLLPDFEANLSDNKINYMGKIISGKGELNIAGNATIEQKNYQATAQLTGENLLVSNTPEYQIQISPQISVIAKKSLVGVKGKIFIPFAKIRPGTYSTGVTLPQEVVFVKEQPTKKIQPWPINAELSIALGDVDIDVMNLQGKLQGGFNIIDTVSRPTLASGVLTIKHGTYTVYGQELKVVAGSLHFDGGVVTNPTVNVQATRTFNAMNIPTVYNTESQTLAVGLTMHGPLENLQVDLFSVPSGLNKADILSYLIIGQPSDQATSAKAQLLFKAAQALNFSGAGEISNVVAKLRSQFGFSELGFGTETKTIKSTDTLTPKNTLFAKPGESLATTTSFVLGRFLTPKIYLSYSMGLLDPVNIFRVKYLFSRHLSIQSETSSLGNGADLLFSIERD